MSASLVVVGLMSGTSADGIDAAVVRIGWPVTLDIARSVSLHTRPFSPDERERVFRLFETKRASVEDLCVMNFALGEWFAEAALGALAAAGLDRSQVDLIGSHGQTVFHAPPGGELPASTLQIGEPSVIAERTGITTVADFRVRDMAAGGHGAPLVSYVDALLFGHPSETRAVLNLGGIANVTVLPPPGRGAAPIAFDTGPANMVLDWLTDEVSGGALRYDEGGRLAAAGRVDEALLAELLADPYFAAPPPKTTGRERYGAGFARSLLERARARGLRDQDVLATALALTVESVARGIEASALTHGEPSEIIAGGGGTQNPTLMAALRRRLPGARVSAHEDHGLASQAKEAVSFAILASAAIRGETNSLASCTGAGHAVVMGKIVPGANYRDLMRKVLAA
ncbi:MAG TPA: anhydro-N-acetylmuramic acid kinase [Chloroflexota bacterium]|nr:anhydro-N-acetylmuramic acid kinase [Chloroflexota bacterium]